MWFDFNQAMGNLDRHCDSGLSSQAQKACALFFLYFHLSEEGQEVQRQDLLDLLSPYMDTLNVVENHGC